MRNNIELKMKDIELEIRCEAFEEVLNYFKSDKELQESPAGERLGKFLVEKYAAAVGEKMDVTLRMMSHLMDDIKK